MANTIDADLISEVLSQTGLTVVGQKLTGLSALSTDFSDETTDARMTVKVGLASASGVLTNPTNYEQTDTTVAKVPVALNILSRPFEIDNQSMNKGMRLEGIAKANMNALAEEVMKTALGIFTAGNGYAASAVVPANAADFDSADAKQVWGEIKAGPKGLILDSAYFANLLPNDLNSFTPQANKRGYGFDVLDDVSSEAFGSADANTVGIGVNPAAAAVASRIPVVPPAIANILESYAVQTHPELGISFGVAVWGSAASRALWGSFDIAFGIAPGDTGAAVVIKHA